MDRPRLVPGGVEPPDMRVLAVREVLDGERVPEVARRRQINVAVLHRWVAAFVDAALAVAHGGTVGVDQDTASPPSPPI